MAKNDYAVAPSSWIDSLGTTVSIACAIQCSVFPLLVGVLPLLGVGFLLGEGVEKIFVATSVILAVSSFTWGFRYHRRFHGFVFLVYLRNAGFGRGPFSKSALVPTLRGVRLA